MSSSPLPPPPPFTCLQREPIMSQEPCWNRNEGGSGSRSRSVSNSNHQGYGSPIFGQGSDTITVAFQSQLTSLENRLSRQITQVSRCFDRRLEEAIEGLDSRIREYELGQPRFFRRLAEVNSQLKVLTEEMTEHNVRLDIIDARTLDRWGEVGAQGLVQQREPLELREPLQRSEPLQLLREPLQQRDPLPAAAIVHEPLQQQQQQQQGGSSKAFTPATGSYSYPQAPETPSTTMPGHQARRSLRFEDEYWGGEGSPSFATEGDAPPSSSSIAMGGVGLGVGVGVEPLAATTPAPAAAAAAAAVAPREGFEGPRCLMDVVRSLEERSAALDRRMDTFEGAVDICLREARATSIPELEGRLRETSLQVEGITDAVQELRQASEAAVQKTVVAGLDARLSGLESELLELPGLSRRVMEVEAAAASAGKRQEDLRETVREIASLRESMEARIRALEPLASEPVAANAIDALRKLEKQLQGHIETSEEKSKLLANWQDGTTAGLRFLEESLHSAEQIIQTSCRKLLEDTDKKLLEVSSELYRTSCELQDVQKTAEALEKTSQDSAIATSRLPWLQEHLDLITARVDTLTGLPSSMTEVRHSLEHLEEQLAESSRRLDKTERIATTAQATATRVAGSAEELRTALSGTESRLLNRVVSAEASLDVVKRDLEYSESLRQKENLALAEKDAKKKAEQDASTMSVLESVATSLAEIEGRLEGKLLQTMSKLPDDLGKLEDRLLRRLDISDRRTNDFETSLSAVTEGTASLRAKLGSWDEEFEALRRTAHLLREGLDHLSSTTSEDARELHNKVSKYEETLQLITRQQQSLEHQLQQQAVGFQDSTERVSSQEYEVAALRGRLVDALAEQGSEAAQFRVELDAADSRMEAAEASIRAFGLRMDTFGGAARSPTNSSSGTCGGGAAIVKRLEERIDAMERARHVLEAKLRVSDERINFLLSSGGAMGAAAATTPPTEPTAGGPSLLVVEPVQQQQSPSSRGGQQRDGYFAGSTTTRADSHDPDLTRAARAVFREVLPRLGAVGDTQDNLQRSLSALAGRMAQLEEALYGLGPPGPPAPPSASARNRQLVAAPTEPLG